MSRALELADLVEDSRLTKESLHHVGQQAAAELRRLERVNAELVELAREYLAWVDPLIKDIGMQNMERKALAALTSATKEQQK
jgi:hypothetical protein